MSTVLHRPTQMGAMIALWPPTAVLIIFIDFFFLLASKRAFRSEVEVKANSLISLVSTSISKSDSEAYPSILIPVM